MPEVADVIKNQRLTVSIGTKVLIEVNGEPQTWEIVNIGEADISKGKISCEAPLAKCILGAGKEDRISCKIINNDVAIIIKRIFLLS